MQKNLCLEICNVHCCDRLYAEPGEVTTLMLNMKSGTDISNTFWKKVNEAVPGSKEGQHEFAELIDAMLYQSSEERKCLFYEEGCGIYPLRFKECRNHTCGKLKDRLG